MSADARILRPGVSEPALSARPPRARPLFASALAAACLLAATGGAQAQQTVIIGGGPAASQPLGQPPGPVSGAGAVGTIGSGASGIVVNDAVLDSLGPGTPAAGVPPSAPQTPVYGSRIAPPGGIATAPYPAPGGTGAYRLPGTGELVVTRPSTLLYPPMEPPRSRLAVPRAQRAAAARPARPAEPASAGKLTSRLIAVPPERSPAKAAESPKAPPAAARPAETARAPEMPEVPARGAAKPAAEMAAAPRVPAPPPAPSLTKEMLADSAGAAPAPKAPAIATSIAPSAPPAAPKAPSVAAPKDLAPKVAAPAVPSVPAAPPADTEVAAIPPTEVQEAARETGVTTVSPDGELRLTFAAGSAELSDAAKQQLQDLAQGLSSNASRRVQLLAFAADTGEGSSRARRLSLSRALAVRAYLIDQGVRSTRMDVRALGSKTGDGPPDRVDVLPN